MPITNQDTKELNQLYSEWNETHGGQKEDYFACIYLKNRFKIDISDLSGRVAFGGNDYGIDAYHIDLATKNLYLYQFKWSEDHNLFKESLQRLTNDGIPLIFDDSFPDPNANEMINHLMAELKEVKDGIKNVLVHFVFKGEREKAEESTGLADRKENLENKRYLIEKYFGRTDVQLSVEFISGSRMPIKQEPRLSYNLLLLRDDCVRTEADGKTMYVGFVPIMDLFQIYKSLGQKFLDRNIRMGLSGENSPNKNIRKTLADIVLNDKTSPDLFSFNHNGVTLAAEHIDFNDTHAVIKVPRLLNGAQTITSMAKFMEEYDGHPELKTNKNLLDRIKVLAKIVVADPHSEFVTNVTICNNRQNPVEPWNLRANDRIQCDLHDKFKEQASVFYSRQEKSFNHYSSEELEEMMVDTFRDIKIKPLAQTFLAIQGEINRMYDLPQVFENQKWYEDTFRRTYLDCDFRKIVIAYKIHLVSKDPMRRLEERLSQKHYNVISKGKHLVWSLLIQGIFNDPKLKDYLEDYGTNLIKELSFREYLKTLASSKLVPILKSAFANEEYKARIEKEKYDFLRTKDFFNHCKGIAEESHGWTKSRYRYQLNSNEKELIMLTFPRALYKILSSLSVKTQIAVCEDLIRTLNSKKQKKEGSKPSGNLAAHFVKALEKNKNFNQIDIPMIKKSRTKSTNSIAIIMKNSGPLSFKTPEGENYEFVYVDHEIHHLRAASKKEQNVTASIDYIATAGSVPILGEIKLDDDQNPFYAFIQLLTYLSEFATPNQVQRCLKENLFKNRENQLAHFDLHIMLGNFNNKSEKFVLIELTKKLATAFKKRLNNEHPKEAQLLNNIYCIHVKVAKPETSFSKLECLWVV